MSSKIHSFRNSCPASRQLLGGVLLLTLCASLGQAQESNHRDRRVLIVGELVGRADLAEMQLLTGQGPVAVFGDGNGRPFRIVSQNPQKLELEFHPSVVHERGPEMIVYKFYETERSLISALILDEVDFAILENEKSAIEVEKSNPHFLPLPVQMPKNRVKLICYNHRNSILTSRNVRKALAYAINYDNIKRRILDNKANLAQGPFDSDSPLYNNGMEGYKNNPRKAIQLLRDVGWRDSNRDGIVDKNGQKLSFELLYQKGLSIDAAISRQIKINLLEIEVEVNPKPLTKRQINERLAARDFDAVLMDHTFANTIESLEAFFSEDGEQNYMGYSSQTFERYLEFYHEVDDPEKKLTLIKSMQRVINQDQPVSFLYFKWWTHYVINVEKLDNFRDLEDIKGRIRPFEEWLIKQDNARPE